MHYYFHSMGNFGPFRFHLRSTHLHQEASVWQMFCKCIKHNHLPVQNTIQFYKSRFNATCLISKTLRLTCVPPPHFLLDVRRCRYPSTPTNIQTYLLHLVFPVLRVNLVHFPKFLRAYPPAYPQTAKTEFENTTFISHPPTYKYRWASASAQSPSPPSGPRISASTFLPLKLPRRYHGMHFKSAKQHVITFCRYCRCR